MNVDDLSFLIKMHDKFDNDKIWQFRKTYFQY